MRPVFRYEIIFSNKYQKNKNEMKKQRMNQRTLVLEKKRNHYSCGSFHLLNKRDKLIFISNFPFFIRLYFHERGNLSK